MFDSIDLKTFGIRPDGRRDHNSRSTNLCSNRSAASKFESRTIASGFFQSVNETNLRYLRAYWILGGWRRRENEAILSPRVTLLPGIQVRLVGNANADRFEVLDIDHWTIRSVPIPPIRVPLTRYNVQPSRRCCSRRCRQNNRVGVRERRSASSNWSP